MRKYFILAACLLLALLFLYAAYNKLSIYQTFVSQLEGSPLVGKLAFILSWLVPALEIIIAALLLYSPTRLHGLYAAFFLMLAFTAYVYILPHFFASPGCSCGGIISRFSWKGHFWFNLAFTLLAGTALSLFPEHHKSEYKHIQTL